MKIIKSITDAPTKKDDNDQDVLIPLSIGIELENRLDNDTAVDLQFKIGFKEYSEMFNRVFG
ncbi:MAG TPA: hypothetical protein VL854_05745, partial [Nitrososphaeraceae archaeon]|nr:hypothetical protein [Nitrososphaeraceae archaeon]